MTDLNGSLANTSWVMTIYTLAMSVFMITASKIADRFDRKKIMLLGLLLFGGFSAACMTATSLSMLITFRFFQGLGGAIITPIVLPMGIEVFGKEKINRVASVVGAVTALAAAGGPPIGGIILQVASWRWIFGINVPLAILAFVLIAVCAKNPMMNPSLAVSISGACLSNGRAWRCHIWPVGRSPIRLDILADSDQFNRRCPRPHCVHRHRKAREEPAVGARSFP